LSIKNVESNILQSILDWDEFWKHVLRKSEDPVILGSGIIKIEFKRFRLVTTDFLLEVDVGTW